MAEKKNVFSDEAFLALNYEQKRQVIVDRNKQVLKEICQQIKPFLNKENAIPHPRVKIPQNSKPFQRKQAKLTSSDGESDVSTTSDLKRSGLKRRWSARLRGKEADTVSESTEDDESDLQVKNVSKSVRPMAYGKIAGIAVGTVWETRLDCNRDSVHRPTVAGIHPGPEGAYSIALSGNYADNVDIGVCFTYSGEGGRDLKGTKANPKNLRTAAQTKDQTLSRGNQALVRSVETGKPVRVIRGYKLESPYAPQEGYRYDGLYQVKRWWYETGVTGFKVYRFALVRMEDQELVPWEEEEEILKNTESPTQ